MPRSNNRVEHEVDSLLFVLANKPRTALALVAIAVGLLTAGYILGALFGG